VLVAREARADSAHDDGGIPIVRSLQMGWYRFWPVEYATFLGVVGFRASDRGASTWPVFRSSERPVVGERRRSAPRWVPTVGNSCARFSRKRY